MDRPTTRPEGAVLRLARQAAGLSIPDAVRLSGVSKARWSQVESGRETRGGVERPVQAKADTLARMARAVGLTADRLEDEAGRPDAAEVLREIIRQGPEPGARPPLRAAPAPSEENASPSEKALADLVAAYPDDEVIAAMAAQRRKSPSVIVAEVYRWLDFLAREEGGGEHGASAGLRPAEPKETLRFRRDSVR